MVLRGRLGLPVGLPPVGLVPLPEGLVGRTGLPVGLVPLPEGLVGRTGLPVGLVPLPKVVLRGLVWFPSRPGFVVLP